MLIVVLFYKVIECFLLMVFWIVRKKWILWEKKNMVESMFINIFFVIVFYFSMKYIYYYVY